jgi:peptide/nickel transport system permease protein
MISNGQKFLTAGEWWLTLFPGLVIALIVLAINVVGDWLRDYLDPRADLVNAEAR